MAEIQRKTEISLSKSLKNSIFVKKDIMMEVWKDIEGYEGVYMVSNWGNVKSIERLDSLGHLRKERILKTEKNNNGYLHVGLCKNGKQKQYYIHRLVAQAFIDNLYNLQCINHKNENKTDNRVENLEWCDHLYNNNYGTRNKKLSKIVYQYSLNNEFIREWSSVNEVERQLGYSNGNISQCCNGQRKTAYNYKWTY